jgi:tetratricopeptide (TPR) repeat protein
MTLPSALLMLLAASPAATPQETKDPHAGHREAAVPSLSLATLAEGAKLLPNLGAHRRRVAVKNPEARKYFDQGLRLTYGFNHDEAARSFAKAGVLDESCAMCFWGAALTLGPNYNVPMLPERAAAAWEALGRAKLAVAKSSPVEKALVEALSTRYAGPNPLTPEQMQPFNIAYANAMRKVAQRYPKDADILALAAEAMMNVNPWKLWSLDGKPAEGTEEIVKLLESALALARKHPGANHYYIHAVEASSHPERAVPSAEKLGSLVPGAGHIVHMPAHIFQRVGRYADASKANRDAANIDLATLEQLKPWGYYPIYLSHNFGFLAYSASMEGRREETMTAAREMAKVFPKEITCGMPGMDYFQAIPQLAAIRFGLWDEALAAPQPEAKYLVQTGLWLHARGMALAAKGKLPEARAQLGKLRALETSLPPDLVVSLSPAKQLFGVAGQVLSAFVLEQEKSPAHLEAWAQAVASADQLPYSEPADWFYPVRHFQGAALLRAGKATDAEAVYREDLRRNPKNGWALFGLAQSLRAQKKDAEAATTEATFKEAWKGADVTLTASTL